DVYYLVVSTPNDTPPSFGMGLPYQVTLSGMAATTFGSFRSGGGTGSRMGDSPLAANVIQVASGSMGFLRVGAGSVAGGGMENDSTDVINNADGNADDMANFRICTVRVAGNLYGIYTGSDVNGPSIFVSGNLGSFVTGQSNSIGTGPTQGDLDM